MLDLRAKAKAWQQRRAMAVTVAAFSAVALLAPAAPATADTPPPLTGTVPVAGAQIIGEQWLTDRTLQLTVATDAFSAPAPVEVVFPVGYDPSGSQQWPVTYHTHGTNGNETWFRATYAGEELTTSYPSIVVVPKGESGYWSNWLNNGPRNYETFVMDQLIPLVDANFHTIPDRAHRAIMGDSMGGYGSLMLAARHPDKFAAAASLSGADDSNYAPAIISASPTLMGAPADSIYGPRLTEEVRWRGHNPTDLAENLRGVDLQLFSGSGILDPTRGESATSLPFCAVEGDAVRPETVNFHQALTSLGISHSWEDLSWGCHSPAMFKYEISQAIQRFQTVFAQAPTAPQNFDYTSINPSFDVYGWHVAADAQRALEFLTLNDVNANGLTVTGSGTTTITTPPLFNGAKQITVTANGIPTSVQPDKNGRITFTVRLGMADTQQQYTLGAVTRQTSTVVTFVR